MINAVNYNVYTDDVLDDGIGNRTSVEQSRDDGQPPRSFGYTPNALNQYSAMTHPSFVEVSGSAAESSTVTVNNEATTRQGGTFRKELTGDNSAGPQWLDAEITDGTTTADGSLPLPPASVTPIHDNDGNLTFDGLWNYTWDATNRLIRIERSAALVTAGAPYLRIEYDYDSQGRRIRSSTFTTNAATTPSKQTLFIFHGWKCVAELDALDGNQAIRKFTWGIDQSGSMQGAGGVGGLLAVNLLSSIFFPTYDGNGNVSEHPDDSGAIVAHYKHDRFLSLANQASLVRWKTTPSQL